jgi:DNA-binding IclR family transcriptional regulator
MPRRDPPAEEPADPADLVAGLARAHVAARCLHVIADCGAADAVGDAGATPAELAAHTGMSADALGRMLRLLAAHGIFAHGPDGRYVHSAA